MKITEESSSPKDWRRQYYGSTWIGVIEKEVTKKEGKVQCTACFGSSVFSKRRCQKGWTALVYSMIWSTLPKISLGQVCSFVCSSICMHANRKLHSRYSRQLLHICWDLSFI